MKPYWPSRRDALKTAVTLLTVSVSARSLRLSASAQVPEKIVLGTLPIPGIVSSIGQVDFFKEEGLTLELTRFNNFAPVLQAMTTGSVAEQKYQARTVANATELVPYAGLGTFGLRREFADTHPEAARKLYRACIRFARWIDDNPVDNRRVVAKNLSFPADLAVHMRIALLARNGLPVMPNVWNLYEMLMGAKTIDPHPNPAKLFNDAIVEPTKRFTLPAVEELGLQPDPEIETMLKGDYPFLPKSVESYYADWERQLLKM